MKITTERVRLKALSKGGMLLSPTISSTHYKVKYRFRCDKLYEWESNIPNIMSGKWCPICGGRQKLTLDTLEAYAQKKGGHCINLDYINVDFRYDWQCQFGHVWRASATNVLHGHTWCPECASNNPKTIETLQKVAAAQGGRILSQLYRGVLARYQWECAKGHTWTGNANNIANHGHWCKKCSVTKCSKGEAALFQSIVALFPDAESGRKGLFQNPRLEIDIWIPSARIAIEYDGSYWHKSPLVQARDKYKNEQSPILGIKLLRIDDAEYRRNPAEVTRRTLEIVKASTA